MSRILHSLRRLRSDASAAALVEFALVCPVLFAMLIGIAELGILFLANAGLSSAVEDAARYATIYPRPTQSAITSRISANRWGLNAANITGPTVTFNTTASPKYVDISMSYNVTIYYVLGSKTITLTQTRRAYCTDYSS
jgi:Flp pilus assembly protein TadG